MTVLNFNMSPYGKTYYETNKEWKYTKQYVKQILDKKESSRLYKINMIISILENYKSTYLIKKSKGVVKYD